MKNAAENTENHRLESLLATSAARHPQFTAIVEWSGYQWLEITNESLAQQSKEFAAQLLHHGLKPGERVIVMSHNRIQAVIALWGVWIAKGTVVLIDPDLPESARFNQCEIADVRFAVTDQHAINLQYLIVITDHGFKWQENEGALSQTIFDDCEADIAAIIFTSGTTGDYKGVMLTHRNFGYLSKKYSDLEEPLKTALSVLPLFHVAGLFSGILQPLILNNRVVMFRKMTSDALQDAFLKYQPETLITVPRLLEVLDQKIISAIKDKSVILQWVFHSLIHLSYFLQRYLHINLGKILFRYVLKKFGGKLKTILCGSAHLSSTLQKRFLSYGLIVRCSYGLTETTGGITLTKPSYRFQSETVGQCVDQNDLTINNGEIIYKGDALMSGYFRDNHATKTAIIDGYFYTRDLGRLDRHNNLFITGRLKELIVFSDGKKAMPEQIEMQYKTIVGIAECAVFGVENLAVIAFVPTENSDVQLITQKIFQRATELKSPYKISDVMVMSELPRSNTLKIKRYELFIKYQRHFGSSFVRASVDSSQLEKKIIACFQVVLPDKKKSITENITFAELGIDSLTAARLCEVINAKLHLNLQPTTFWFSHNIRELCHSSFEHNNSIQPLGIAKNTQEPIAIIAVDGIFPMARMIDLFWNNLIDGKDAITKIPLSRWNYRDYYDPYLLAPGKINSQFGGFIDLPDDFNYEQFGIKQRIAESIDPQQKILLMLTKRLLENYSGKNAIDQWQGSNTGFFIGAGFPDFMLSQMQHLPLTQINPYSGIGMADVSLSARVAFHFGFEGPAMVIKTACSSSLVAVHQAVRALQAGDCDVGIAGGINLIQIPEVSICLTKGGFLSPDGRCKTFDADANGYVRSEGCGMVLLKRYSDAVRDHDKILSVIVGSAINQDGASNGITAPNGKSQIVCYRKALENARIPAEKVQYVEAHGSGTQLGDAIEMQSIQAVYDQNRSNKLYVGAVKSSIGHCESAAGIAGLIKTIDVLNHQIIPPNLHYQKQNSNISFEKSAVQLPKKIMHFETPCDYAAVSSFGIAGTNVHMIISRAFARHPTS